jgi:hypothetical protein
VRASRTAQMSAWFAVGHNCLTIVVASRASGGCARAYELLMQRSINTAKGQ